MADFAIPAREYALVFGTAVVVTFLLTGVVRLIAVQIGAVTGHLGMAAVCDYTDPS